MSRSDRLRLRRGPGLQGDRVLCSLALHCEDGFDAISRTCHPKGEETTEEAGLFLQGKGGHTAGCCGEESKATMFSQRCLTNTVQQRPRPRQRGGCRPFILPHGTHYLVSDCTTGKHDTH